MFIEFTNNPKIHLPNLNFSPMKANNKLHVTAWVLAEHRNQEHAPISKVENLQNKNNTKFSKQ